MSLNKISVALLMRKLKMDTINRLLKKQAPKRRKKADITDVEMDDDDNPIENRPPAAFVRIVRSGDGVRIGVPQEWLQAPVGEIFDNAIKENPTPKYSGKMVEVME